jgi:hypothetical protein
VCARADLVHRARQGALCGARQCLAIFPEGTTTDGTNVAHFHPSLLQPAIDAGAQVHPIAIRYQDDNGTHSTTAAYIDDLSFGASMWRILSTPVLHARLIATPPLGAHAMDRRSLARMSHERISTALHLAASPNFHIPLTPSQHPAANLLPSTR